MLRRLGNNMFYLFFMRRTSLFLLGSSNIFEEAVCPTFVPVTTNNNTILFIIIIRTCYQISIATQVQQVHNYVQAWYDEHFPFGTIKR